MSAINQWDVIAEAEAPKINAQILKLEESGQIQAGGEEFLTTLEKTGLSYRETVHWSKAGVSSVNRESEMISVTNFHNLLKAICRKGWKASETWMALAGEMPDGESGQHERAKNRQLIDNSGGLLPDLDVSELEIITGACSHTTTVLRAVALCETQRIPGSDAIQHLCVKGMLSKQRILEVAPSLQSPTETGLTYTIIRKEIMKRCPDLLRVLSEADNAKHGNFQKETAMQTMKNIHRRAIARNAKTHAEWHAVVVVVSRSHDDEFVKTASCYADFVKQYSGGTEAPILALIDKYSQCRLCFSF